jgi:hypothetical protein
MSISHPRCFGFLLAQSTASEAKARHTATVTTIVIAKATSLGIRNCSQCCNGQTIAMMKSASTSGANTVLA